MEKSKRLYGLFGYLIFGIVAILTIYPVQKAAIETQMDKLPVDPGVSVETLAIIALLNPFILLLIALIIGYFIADKVSFVSIVLHRHVHSKIAWKPALVSGGLLGVIFIGFDLLLRPFLPDVFTGPIQPPSFVPFISAILYGGVVEELLMRFGFMSLVTFLLWKVFQRAKHQPSNGVYIIAIVISALVFALGHYGATAAVTDMTPIVCIRMLVLNGLGGMVFGWLYWKDNLETAMIAHMMTHVAMNVITLVLSIFL